MYACGLWTKVCLMTSFLRNNVIKKHKKRGETLVHRDYTKEEPKMGNKKNKKRYREEIDENLKNPRTLASMMQKTSEAKVHSCEVLKNRTLASLNVTHSSQKK